jgi:hypothetical protein
MNTDAIFQKYWKTLLDLGIASEVDSAIALALRLAIQEAADANAALVNDMSAIIANLRSQELVPESALVAAQNEVSMLRQQRGTLIEEAEQLRQQLAQLDADNADLTKKLAAFNQTASIQDVPVMHVNGNGTAPAPFDWKHPISTEQADYWESLDAGRRSFRQLDKRIRLDLVQTALASFEQMPTQAAFNAAKPEWMPTATGLCTAFNCKWEDLPTLKWEQVKL